MVMVNLADVEGIDLGDAGPLSGLAPTSSLPDQERRLAEQIVVARRAYAGLCATESAAESSPVLSALCDGPLIRLFHRSRGCLSAALVPGACCLPGQRRLHATVDGTFQPCERVGETMPIGTVESGIDLAAVARIQREFHRALDGRCRDCWAVRMCGICFTALAPTWRAGHGVSLR